MWRESENVQSASAKWKPSRLDGFTQIRPLLLQAVILAVDLNAQVSKSRLALP